MDGGCDGVLLLGVVFLAYGLWGSEGMVAPAFRCELGGISDGFF
jgi:hypothetical protein